MVRNKIKIADDLYKIAKNTHTKSIRAANRELKLAQYNQHLGRLGTIPDELP